MDEGIGAKAQAVKPKRRFTVDRYCETGACCKLTGGKLAAAFLLHRIHQRLRGKGLRRDGKKWIAMTGKQIRRELGDWSVDRYNDALADLKKLELIECMHNRVGGRRQKITWLRLTDKAAAAVEGAYPSENSDTSKSDHSGNSHTSAVDPSENSHTSTSDPSDFPYTYTKEIELTKETENQGKGKAAPAATADPALNFSQKGSQEGGEIIVPETVIETAPGGLEKSAALPALIGESNALAKITSGTPTADVFRVIAEYWASLTTDHARQDVRGGWVRALSHRGGLPTKWSGKDWGQAKTLRDALSDYPCAFVVFVCVLQWEKFHGFCKQESAKSDHWRLSPAPTLDCLVLFRDHAAYFANEHLREMKAGMEEAAKEAAKAAADAKAKAEYEATLIVYRGMRFTPEGKEYGGDGYDTFPAASADERSYIKTRRHLLSDIWQSKEAKAVLGISNETTALENARLLDAMIDEIAAAFDAGESMDALWAKYRLPWAVQRHVFQVEVFGQEWARRVRTNSAAPEVCLGADAEPLKWH